MRHRKLIAGGLILALLAVCAAIIFVLGPSIGTRGLRLSREDLVSVEGDEEQSFEVDGPLMLTIDNGGGNITINAADGNQVMIAAHKTAWGADQTDAQQQLAAMKLNVTQNGNAIEIRFEQPARDTLFRSRQFGQIDLDIRVPVTATVDASTMNGDVTLSGSRGEAKLHTQFGLIEANDLIGNLSATTQNGQITTRNVQASALIDLTSNFGDITILDSTTLDVKVHSRNGQVSLTRVHAGGDATLNSDFGSLKFEEGRARTLAASTRNGAIELSDLTIEHALQAESEFGKVTLNQALAATYDLHTRNGPIEVSGALGAGPHMIQTDFGSIHLTLPGDSALQIDLETGFGRIRSALPILITDTLDEAHWRGTINGGGAGLTAHTRNGDIVLDLLNP